MSITNLASKVAPWVVLKAISQSISVFKKDLKEEDRIHAFETTGLNSTTYFVM